jgi:putative transposase
MCRENPSWGAPRIHGELLKLGIDIGESSVSKYMLRFRKPPSKTWRTFLENHAQQLVSIDFFTVPTIRFQVLYVFLVLAHDRRRILHFNVTAHPTRGVDRPATAGGMLMISHLESALDKIGCGEHPSPGTSRIER